MTDDVAPAPLRTRPPGPKGAGFARAACFVGVAFAVVSLYWGLGGTRLLDTLGGWLGRSRVVGSIVLFHACSA